MKVALCLSGLIKNTLSISNHIFNNIINPNNADVFIHTWNTSNIQQIITTYQPKKYIVEEPKIFKKSSLILSDENIKYCFPHFKKHNNPSEVHTNNVFSMWYGINMAILMKELYSLENNITYDFVVRLRFDVCPNMILNFNNFDSNYLHYLDLEQTYDMISDWFGFGNNDIMNIYGNVFYNIKKHFDKLQKDPGIWCNELLLRNHMKENNVSCKKIKVNVNNCVYWGT